MRLATGNPRLRLRPAPAGARRLSDALLLVWMAWVFDIVNNLGPVRQRLAERHGASLLDAERSLHLAPELSLNTWLSTHHVLSQIVVLWYVNVHGAVTFAVFGWLWWRRPEVLPPLRAALFLGTAVGGIVFWLFPVAPPRMLIGGGYVDLVQTANGAAGWRAGDISADANQLAALPSIHVAWAVWAAIALWRLSSRPWLRCTAVAYPVVTTFAVMATGNHYLADGALGGAIAGVAVCSADRGWARRPRARISQSAAVAAETSAR